MEAVLAAAMTRHEVAQMVFDAIRKEQFYILTDPAWIDAIRLRTTK
jgi:hypothetical protein